MSIRSVLNIIFLLFLTNCFSQGETNFWYFGFNAGLDFNSGSPVPIHNGQLYTEEGSTVISDPFGALLFYTDGITVYNKNHQVMLNGTGLLGHTSSTQSALVIPKPGSNTIYYLFTTPNMAGGAGMNYSEIDLTLDGGLGGVTSVKNVHLIGPVCEKITAVRNGTGGFWVASHGFNGIGGNAGGDFYAYSVTASGVNTTPVVTTIGAIAGGLVHRAIGYMKFSPDGKNLVIANNDSLTEVFNFDRTTGVFSNRRTVSEKKGSYGVEFSPSGKYLYLTLGDGEPTQLFQFDMSVTNIASTGRLIFEDPTGQRIYAIQLASDFKMYIAMKDTPYLSVVNKPDEFGAACDFVKNAVNVSPGKVMMGLPQFIQSYFFGAIEVKKKCLGNQTQFELLSDIVVSSILWDFGDGQTSTDLAPSHQYAAAGNYTVTVTATSVDGSISKRRDITIFAPPVFATTITNQKVCEPLGNNSIDLNQFTAAIMGAQSATDYGVSYFASLAGAQNHFTTLSSTLTLHAGVNKVFAKIYHLLDNECSVITAFDINLYERAEAHPAADLYLCDDISNDGKGIFDLKQNDQKILKFQNKNIFKLSYHSSQADADSGLNPLPTTYQNTTNPQEIFARVQNNNFPDCYETTMFKIVVTRKPIAVQPATMFECDDESNDGKAKFDLKQQDADILGLQSAADYTISYYSNLQDAEAGIDRLAFEYTSDGPNQVIFARVESKFNSLCYDVTSFPIAVKDKPSLQMKDIYALCEGNPSLTINAPLGFDSYLWSNGDIGSSTTITKLGDYNVTVTTDYGDIICSAVKNFTVKNSNPATIKNIKVVDWDSSYSSITVDVTGDGDYEYSLDGTTYQDSNQFTGLDSGEYVVYIKDKHNCGIVKEEVVVLVYPKYFTPNGDGINDTWSIKFALIYEPNMELKIFDRYGKLLSVSNASKSGWDGKLNGQELPATDYWFVVTREDGRIFKGHFSLVR